jgi:hypothetical protein
MNGARPELLLSIGGGWLLGGVIALLEFAYYYPLVAPDGAGAGLLLSLVIVWGGEGMILGLAVGLFERTVWPRLLSVGQLLCAVLVGSLAGVPAWQAFVEGVLRDRFGLRRLRDYMGQPVDLASIVFYNIWLMLIFGGLAAAAYLFWQRHVRMLAQLRSAELAREESQRRLAQTQLAALRARVDPDFLFRALQRLERLYESHAADADRLMEELIAFLRTALAEERASGSALY